MNLKVIDRTDNLEIKNVDSGVTAVVPYQQEKSYFANVINWIGESQKVVDFESFKGYDLFTIEEIKR